MKGNQLKYSNNIMSKNNLKIYVSVLPDYSINRRIFTR